MLRGINTHDDGWAARDQQPQITRQGKPSAFSVELVGKYSAFEEIDLADYLAVRERAVRMVAEADAYAALLVSMHTYNLLTARADRTTIQPDQLPLLDAFLARQLEFQQDLQARLAADKELAPEEISPSRIEQSLSPAAGNGQPVATELCRLCGTGKSAASIWLCATAVKAGLRSSVWVNATFGSLRTPSPRRPWYSTCRRAT